MFYGLDLHKRFIQVCRIDGDGRARHDFQIETTRDAITAFAQTLGPDDAVVLEATFHTWAVWALLVPHAGRVVVANPLQVRAIAHARVKTDKVDAHILAQALSQMSTPLTATYHRLRRKRGHNVAVTALARKLIVLVWHLLQKNEPYRYAPIARTRTKLRRLTPGLPPARPGQVPRTLAAVYEEMGLPLPAEPTPAERRVAARNQRTVTIARSRASTV